MNAGCLRIVAYAIEQYRLAHPTETHYQDAARRAPESYALQRNAYPLAKLIAPSQLGRRGTCPRRVRVADRVH
jgi:hypothetical protein